MTLGFTAAFVHLIVTVWPKTLRLALRNAILLLVSVYLCPSGRDIDAISMSMNVKQGHITVEVTTVQIPLGDLNASVKKVLSKDRMVVVSNSQMVNTSVRIMIISM